MFLKPVWAWLKFKTSIAIFQLIFQWKNVWPRSSIKPYGAAKNLEAVGLGLTESEREKEEEASRRSLDLRPLGSSQRSLVLWLTINNTETIVKCLQAATRTRDNLVLNWACLVARKRNLTGHATPKTIRMKRPPQPSSSDLSGRKTQPETIEWKLEGNLSGNINWLISLQVS